MSHRGHVQEFIVAARIPGPGPKRPVPFEVGGISEFMNEIFTYSSLS